MTRSTFRQLTELALILAIFLLAIPAVAQEGRLDVIQVSSKGLEGNLLGDSATRNVTVYLPAEYDEEGDKRYPVVYLLHGYLGRNTLWTGEGYVKDLHINEIADKLIDAGEIEPMILVAPDCYNEHGGSWYTNSPVTGKWEDFVTKDLISHIDRKYRTIPERESRGIAGHSMGGYGAIKLAMKHPKLFCCLYAMAPASVDLSQTLKEPLAKDYKDAAATKTEVAFSDLFWRARARIAQAAAFAPNLNAKPFYGDLPLDSNGNQMERVWRRWLTHDLSTTVLTNYGANLKKYRAFAVDCGTEDPILPAAQAFIRTLNRAGIRPTYEEFKGNHLNGVAMQLETSALPLFSKTLQHSKPVPAEAIR